MYRADHFFVFLRGRNPAARPSTGSPSLRWRSTTSGTSSSPSPRYQLPPGYTTTLGPCLHSPRQATESTRTSPFIRAARSSSLSALRIPLEPRFLQSPPAHTRTWASWSRTLASDLARDGVAREPQASARPFLAFLAFFLEMCSPNPKPGSRQRGTASN